MKMGVSVLKTFIPFKEYSILTQYPVCVVTKANKYVNGMYVVGELLKEYKNQASSLQVTQEPSDKVRGE